MYGIEVKYCPNEDNQWKKNNDATDYFIDQQYSVFIKLSLNFIDKPCKSEPPNDGSGNNT